MPPRKPEATSATPNARTRARNVGIKTTGEPASRPSVLMIGSEALPFSKTGGLADVLGALPQALARLGWDVTLVVPRYRESRVGTLVERFDLRVGGVTADVG